MKRPRVGWDVDRVLLQSIERDDLERPLMRGLEYDIGRRAIHMRSKPVRCGHTPAITRDEPREPILRHRRDQVVADAVLMFEELRGDNRADRVAAGILGTRVTAPIAEESGERIGATVGERSTQHIEIGHGPSIALSVPVAPLIYADRR